MATVKASRNDCFPIPRYNLILRQPLGLIESTWSDMAHGIRQLRRNPAFAGWGILIMALGIASTTVIFSMTYGVLIRDLPTKNPTGWSH